VADKEVVSLRAAAEPVPAQGRAPAKRFPVSEKAPRAPRRRWLRRWLFLLLPLALIAAAYGHVTGGQVRSTDDAHVEAEKVGVSTDVSGIVKASDVSRNQRADGGQVVYLLARSSVRASWWGLGASVPRARG
jgi:membrane fusion protein (multidrug efflux system)